MAVQLEACFWKEKMPSWLFDIVDDDDFDVKNKIDDDEPLR